ncbi:putative pentatricopeptide repeat-containing protein At5g37570 [Zingiber officinale]|uniref:Chlororespiratory reduction 4 n=1 Tax=Zingiber officinale TaxID=94328 RepID=A0A8J5LNS5_ZINOF|nr:putative pentatricopeptide repeat-containing protein At5g37570 [Zingiber officinale]KAG6520155.1 hypothetical protein ZIOFF_017191 [Zingiber officinale]
MAVKPKTAARTSSRYLDHLLLSLRNRSRLPARIWPDDDRHHLPQPPSSSVAAAAAAAIPVGDDSQPPPPLKLSHPLLRALEASGPASTPRFSQTLARIVISGLSRHRLAAGRLVKPLCASPSSIPLAVALFSGVDDPDAFLSNIILRAYINFDQPHQALDFFRRYALPSSVPPNHFTFPLLAKLLAELGLAREGPCIHALASRLGFEFDLYVRNSFIHMYSSLGDVDSARKLFDLDLDSDIVTWNSMIDGYIKNGMVDYARSLFDHMPETDLVTWNVMIAGHTGVGEMDAADHLFVKMPERDSVTWNTLLDGYARKGEIASARQLFDKMPIKNLVSWNIMLALCSRIKDYRECLKLFDSMIAIEDAKPDNATLVSVLTACAHLDDLVRGKWIHSLIMDRSETIRPDVLLSTALVNMYSKCGDMSSAAEVFDSMEERSVATWNSMIIGYGLHGNGEKALELFIEMEKAGQDLNETTFVCILSACAHGGMIMEGWWCFDRMVRIYKIQPRPDHFGCMLDLLGRAGFLSVSKKLVDGLLIEPVPALLGALMSACSTHCNWKLGEIIGKKLIEMKSQEIGPYVLLSNIYAAQGKWDDVAKLREMMNKNSLQNGVGFSLVSSVLENNGSVGKRNMILSMLCEMGSSIKMSLYNH